MSQLQTINILIFFIYYIITMLAIIILPERKMNIEEACLIFPAVFFLSFMAMACAIGFGGHLMTDNVSFALIVGVGELIAFGTLFAISPELFFQSSIEKETPK